MKAVAARVPPLPRRRDPKATYQAILDAAEALMAERGPEGLTVSEVADIGSNNLRCPKTYCKNLSSLSGLWMQS